MIAPILNILLGTAFIVGGATGRIALFGTSSTTAAVVAGALLAAFGLYQLIRALRDRS
jgi:hypothetical protein